MPKLVIPGRLYGLNEYIEACRRNKYKANKMKNDSEKIVMLAAKQCLRGWKARGPVNMSYLWVEKDRRRDKDNISSYGRKIIQDSLVKAGYLKNDGWAYISDFRDDFAVDKGDPRIEVLIEEITL